MTQQNDKMTVALERDQGEKEIMLENEKCCVIKIGIASLRGKVTKQKKGLSKKWGLCDQEWNGIKTKVGYLFVGKHYIL